MSPTKKRILCVDANENICSMLLDLMRELGHEPRAAASLAAALHAARAETVDLFIIENRLPDGSGAQLAATLRVLAPRAPIIFYSNDPQRVVRAEAARAGAQAFVSKLDDIAELADTVRRLLH
jgi:DNA-binding response OmpR family regulator